MSLRHLRAGVAMRSEFMIGQVEGSERWLT